MSTEFTNYPEALDTFDNPRQFDQLGLNSAPHHRQESKQNDAIAALQQKVGIEASADPDSHEFKIAALLAGTAGGAIITATGVSPEGVTTAEPGAFLWDTVAKALWIKDSGSGNTGWFPLLQFT